MAQNISLWGATYSNVPAVDLPKSTSGTARFTDVTPTTVSDDSEVSNGKIYFRADGSQHTGTNSGGGASKNVQIVQGTTRTSKSAMSAIGAELTVSKSGTYDIYWDGVRSTTSTSYTYATQLYIDGSAHGSENATWTNNIQDNHLTNVSLNQNQKLRVYGRNSRNSSYYIYAPTLVIIEA